MNYWKVLNPDVDCYHFNYYQFLQLENIFTLISLKLQIIRYSFFGMKEALGFEPSWLRWLRQYIIFVLTNGSNLSSVFIHCHSFSVPCRYSTFVVLYPIGILCEIGLICIALPHIKVSNQFIIKERLDYVFSEIQLGAVAVYSLNPKC